MLPKAECAAAGGKADIAISVAALHGDPQWRSAVADAVGGLEPGGVFVIREYFSPTNACWLGLIYGSRTDFTWAKFLEEASIQGLDLVAWKRSLMQVEAVFVVRG
ncbi:MAG: hypothetical protein M1335_06220 [Chloroflexi bacterium]|nr:hypothetical protein [Chloroflexota bacterium]